MTRLFDLLTFIGLLALLVLAPLPLGSNREWSWSLAALAAAGLTLAWAVSRIRVKAPVRLYLHWSIPLLFLLVCVWIFAQQAGWTPQEWHHPLWAMTAGLLGVDLPGRVSLSPQDTNTALMRLLCYGLVFFLALQFGRDRARAQTIYGMLGLAGLAYAVFGLLVYWGDYHPDWLFGERLLPHDVRSTFVNRNHFATWQGLAMLCTMAWFYHRMAKPEVKPYAVPVDRETKVVEFILKAWMPMTALLLMVAALVLTHSRGGFAAALAGTVVLMLMLDRRVPSKSMLSRMTVILALAVVSLAFYLTSELLLDRINRTDITTEARLEVFANVNRAIEDNMALGFGYGTFADSFRLYDQMEDTLHYDRAHNTWLENTFELGLPGALALFAALGGLTLTCWRGVWRRHRDWVFPATGVAASVLVAVHATVDFSLQIPAVAMLYAAILGVGVAQSWSSLET
jgi:O-antigen ligase